LQPLEMWGQKKTYFQRFHVFWVNIFKGGAGIVGVKGHLWHRFAKKAGLDKV